MCKTQSRQKTEEHETLVFQNKLCKIQTYINLFEQNNDHAWVMYEMQCLSSFKDAFIKKNKEIWKRTLFILIKSRGACTPVGFRLISAAIVHIFLISIAFICKNVTKCLMSHACVSLSISFDVF